ncbi:Mov34/MPN/PAD-1 family protein [Afifella pfennigii]|uniref:Mov34/MPN/PAD-1 family protein n=1 Tax=Afifella pfennigii TaxID=209897 RepID=UPI000479C831|nr:Mov34/MPN/PAD-1 family protein [Afifella pfennigii]
MIDAWLSHFEVAAAEDLCSPAAAALVRFVERHGAPLARFVESRHGELGDLIILDFQTGRPQRSFYAIKRAERIAVRFASADAMPVVYMLREDFPDTPHQQLVLEGCPRAICVDDRPWQEARLTWTPAELLDRVLTWFSRAAKGELHDARQPIEPLMLGSPLSFIIPRELVGCAAEQDLIGVHEAERRQTLRVMPLGTYAGSIEDIEPICVLSYRVSPQNMQRLAFAPHNLGSLADMLEQRGISLFDDLRGRLATWLGEEPPAAWRINSRFAIIVEMPIIAPDGAQQDGTDLRAFVTQQSVGDVGVALGAAIRAERGEGSKVGYVPPLTPGQVDETLVREIAAQSAEVHYEFDRTLATRLSGRSGLDERHCVLVGAGAAGSHLADCLVREGRFCWTVIDDDLILPHNLARHTARGDGVTKGKASQLAKALSKTLHSTAAIAGCIEVNLLDGDRANGVEEALQGAEVIIDATASVLAARALSDHPSPARRASAFFNPAGRDAVLLAEPANRSVDLRDLEAQYLGLLAREPALASHLDEPGGTYAYTGACRAITNLIPESRVMTLSGLLAAGLGNAFDQPDGTIKVWSMSQHGGVEVHEATPSPVECFAAGDWSISLDQRLIARIRALRAECLPNETGGVLTGLVDIPAKRIHLIDAAPAPPDSKSSRNGFERGTEGVQQYLDEVLRRTGGHVRYIGEWHSHPPRAGTSPSATDLVQIDWLATLFDMDTLPALMLIVGDKNVRAILANREALPSTTGHDDGLRAAGAE